MKSNSIKVTHVKTSLSWMEEKLKLFMGDSIKTHNLEKREEWLKFVLKDIPAGSRILDAGAGETQYRKLCEHLNYVSQDFGQYDGKGDGSGLQEGIWDNSKLDIICDITNIPEPNESFDAIMCVEVLEHLHSPLKALKEFFRLLRPGGQLILTAPFASLTHFAPYYFYSGFSVNFYKKNLESLGFNVISIAPNGNFFEYLCQELSRLRYVSKEYTKGTRLFNIFEYFCLWVILKSLKRFSAHDNGSDALLCFGYHVRAVKI